MKLIVGLGNPGKEYEHTPHNVGFEVIDLLAAQCDCVLRRSLRFKARLSRTMLGGNAVMLVKPGAFMNQSGPVVAAIAHKLGITPADLLVILDDADLPVGRLRIRVGGSGGGHKGLLSILGCLGQDQFVRIRLGIGRREDRDLVAHVLTPFATELRESARAMIVTAATAVQYLTVHGAEAAMNKFNTQRQGETLEKI